ncbi:MAG TPA: hypothetical protein VGN18_03360 [Jatrophihabitans sp.]|uniref:hypothetical protein n=1 Tax=Jatrophihabitans sp. TaxID=1932789 RepID=UPI002E008CC6|nr:hypothetical protein [Jatrophihabitans sp.]
MTDENPTPVTPGSDDASVPRPGRPAATAASRARRIGGRVTPPRPGPSATETTARPAPTPVGEATSLRTSPAAEPAGAQPIVITEVPGWLKWVPAVVLGVVALAMVVVLAVASHGVWWSKPSPSEIRDRVLAAAKSCTAATNTYKYTAIDAAEAAGVKCTSGAYQGQYKKAMDTLIKTNAPKLKFTQTAQINDAGVVSVTPNGRQWSVLLFGQLAITSTQTGKGGRVDPFAAIVQMENVGGKWLIVKIDPVTAVTG